MNIENEPHGEKYIKEKLNFGEIQEKYGPIFERFCHQYMSSGPLSSGDYVQGFLYTVRKFTDANCPIDKESEVCFVVSLLKPLPENTLAPNEFEGIKVYYEVRGPATLV